LQYECVAVLLFVDNCGGGKAKEEGRRSGACRLWRWSAKERADGVEIWYVIKNDDNKNENYREKGEESVTSPN
jgi:hypothetical protein